MTLPIEALYHMVPFFSFFFILFFFLWSNTHLNLLIFLFLLLLCGSLLFVLFLIYLVLQTHPLDLIITIIGALQEQLVPATPSCGHAWLAKTNTSLISKSYN